MIEDKEPEPAQPADTSANETPNWSSVLIRVLLFIITADILLHFWNGVLIKIWPNLPLIDGWAALAIIFLVKYLR